MEGTGHGRRDKGSGVTWGLGNKELQHARCPVSKRGRGSAKTSCFCFCGAATHIHPTDEEVDPGEDSILPEVRNEWMSMYEDQLPQLSV